MTFDKSQAEDMLVSLLKAESEPDMDKGPVLDVVMPWLEEMGLEVRRHENDGNPAIFASIGEPKVMLSGHLDTVAKGENWTRGQGEVDGTRIYGRGALDMKGPCVSMLLASKALVEDGVDLAITFTTDEETGMAGAKVLAEEVDMIAAVPLIIICEPTDYRPILEEKGIVQMRVSTYGRSAHASMPEEGSNAIENLLVRLNNVYGSGHFGTMSTDPITISVDRISGGGPINVIPDSAEADLDIRFSADQTNDEIYGLMKILLHIEDGLCETELLHELPPARSGLGPEVISRLEEHVGKESGGVPYGTEMAVFAYVNPNILVMGPGNTKVAHKADEWIDVEDVLKTAEIYRWMGSELV